MRSGNGLYAQAPNYAGGGMVPASNFGASGGGGGGNQMWNQYMALSGLGGLFGGLFGNSGGPYDDAMDQYRQWAQKGENAQNPFLQAGTNAINPYQNMLGQMSDPSGFINNLMSKYQQSPGATYQQQQGIRAAQNMGSASGLSGSTPLMQAAQQNAQNISSQDQNQWLGNVLGVNSQALGGYGNLMGMGANSANALTNMYGQMGQSMGDAAYGKGAANNNDFMQMLMGGAQLAMML